MPIVLEIIAWLAIVGFLGFGATKIALSVAKYIASVRSGIDLSKSVTADPAATSTAALSSEIASLRREVKILSDRLDEKDQAIRRLEQQEGFIERMLEEKTASVDGTPGTGGTDGT